MRIWNCFLALIAPLCTWLNLPVPQHMILSIEMELNGWAGKFDGEKNPPTDFIVDYVRVYQYK
jgi:hypothetical protein